MAKDFLIKHWMWTIFCGSIAVSMHLSFNQHVLYFVNFENSAFTFVIAYISSLIFSFPSYVISFLIFVYYFEGKMNARSLKIILIVMGIVLAALTFAIVFGLFGGSIFRTIFLWYTIMLVVTGSLLKLKPQG
jgi:glucan phosphoethanolaminetransferase (alkaline phosphatase superfamily)